MTEEERKHRKRMLKFLMERGEKPRRQLTPQELADAIKDLKKKHPDWPPPLR